MTIFRNRLEEFDHSLAFMAVIMAGFGVLMVYDSSAVSAALRSKFSDQYYFFFRQALWFFAGVSILFIVGRVNITGLRRYAFPALIVIYILLVLVLIPGIGIQVGGARRWLRLGPLSLQPGEPMRFIIILYLSHFLAMRASEIKIFHKTYLPALFLILTGVLLLALQPKIGSAVIVLIISFIMFFVAGVPLYQMALTAICGAPVVLLLSGKYDYILQRVNAWLDPSAHIKGMAYQSTQALIAIGSGRFLGAGLGQGRQKMFYLPEAHTDFIFAVIAEELGLIGALFLIGGYVFLLFKSISIARKLHDRFNKLLAVGLLSSVLTPAGLNLLVATGLFPVTGVPLPLISFGGSALVTDMLALGLIAGLSDRDAL